MSQEELRKVYCERLKREKQNYIAEQIKVDPAILSRFKNAKIDLYPYISEKLEAYLMKN